MNTSLEPIIRTERVPAIAGALADSMFTDKATYANKRPEAVQVDTVTIDTATDTEVYSILINGVDIPVTAASAVAADIAALFVAAINANGLVNGRVLASISGDDVVITGRFEGKGFTTAEGTNAAKMTLVNTTAVDEADPIPFGRLVLVDSDSLGEDNFGYLADASQLTAQVDTLLLTYDAAVGAKVSITVYVPATGLWETFDFEHTMATDADTSVIALSAQMEAILPANTVTALHPVADTLTFTAEVAGTPFFLSYGFGTGRDTGAWVHGSNALSAEVDFAELVAGIALAVKTEEIGDDGETAEYGPNSPMSVGKKARVYVETEAALTGLNQKVYVRLAANGSLNKLGGFSTGPGTGLVEWKGAKWHRKTNNATLAVLSVG